MNEKENKQNRLSEGEKAQIKEAVLKQAENSTAQYSDELAMNLCKAFKLINQS